MAHALANLRRIEFLAKLPAEVAADLSAVSELRHYQDGERVYTQGDRLPGLLLVTRGSLKVFREDGRGRLQVLQFLKPGDCVGEVQVFDGGTVASSAEAHGDTEVWVVPAAPLKQVAHRTPEVAEELIQHFAAKVRHLVHLVETLSLHSVPERVAQLLVEAHGRAPGRAIVEFEETQEDLAQCIGASREAFSRALRLLTDLGLIQNSFPVVRILDAAKLERYANG